MKKSNLFFLICLFLSCASAPASDALSACRASGKIQHKTIENCCCSAGSTTINNTISDISQLPQSSTPIAPAPTSDPKTNTLNYDELSKTLDAVAKKAIDASTTAVDMAKWTIVIFGILIGLAGIIGFKSANELFNEFRKSQQNIREDANEALASLKERGDSQIESLNLKSKKALDKINVKGDEALAKLGTAFTEQMDEFKKEMESSRSGIFLSIFISVAHSQDFIAEQLMFTLDSQKDDPRRANLKNRLAQAFIEIRRDLQNALDYADKAAEPTVKDIIRLVIWNTPKQSENIESRILLKSWINLTIGWICKRQTEYLAQTNYLEAIHYALKSYELTPNDPDTLYNLACYYSLVKDPEKCIFFLKKALTEDPALAGAMWGDNDFNYMKEYHLALLTQTAGPAPQL